MPLKFSLILKILSNMYSVSTGYKETLLSFQTYRDALHFSLVIGF